MSAQAYEAPGPGTWVLDPTHFPRPVTRYFASLFPEPFMRGFREGTARYGLLFSHLEPAVVNGFVYYRDQVVDPGDEDTVRQRFEAASHALQSKIWRADLDLWDREVMPDSIRRNRRLQAVDVKNLDTDALVAHLETVRENAAEMVYRHHQFTIPAVIPVGLYLASAAEWTGLDAGTLLAPLRGSTPVSLGALRELGDLTDALARAGLDANDLAAAPARDTLDGLLQRDDAVGEAARAFLDAVGLRVAGGYDIADSCAVELPEMLLATVRAAMDTAGDAHAGQAAQAVERVRAAVPEAHRERFDELLAEARLLSRIRDERGIYNDNWGTDIARTAVLEAGRRLAESGRIEQADCALDATHDELVAMLRGADAPAKEELAERTRRRLGTPLAEAPPVLGPAPAPPPPLDGLPPDVARMMSAVGAAIGEVFGHAPEAAGEAITGRGVSPGVYTGTARVIGHPAEFERLRQGDVLVTASTSAAFNVVLPVLGAIVTDRGGQLSHAAIVAREYGIPAVVGTQNATRLIADGDRVRVDGTAGTVERV